MDPHERFDHRKPHHWKRLILETLGIALCIGTAGLVFYLWDYDHRVAEEIDMIESGIPIAPIVDKTAGWQTYRSEEYGFEIKHPSEWTPWEGFTVMYDSSMLPAVLRVCFGPEVQTKNYCGVELYIIQEDQFPIINPNTFLGFPRSPVEGLEFRAVFGDKPGIGIETYDPQRPKRMIRNGFLKHNGFVYLLVAYNSEEFQKLQSIVSSFTFLQNPISSANNSNWQTYRNGEYKFEFSYPQNWILKDFIANPNQSSDPYDISVGYVSPAQNAVRGITYCEAYSNSAPERCEVYNQFIIDWQFGSASIQDANGGTIGIGINKLDAESKKTFRQILSTFKFTP